MPISCNRRSVPRAHAGLTWLERSLCAVTSFATTPIPFRDCFSFATKDNLGAARKWVDSLEAAGGTDIAAALIVRSGFGKLKQQSEHFRFCS